MAYRHQEFVAALSKFAQRLLTPYEVDAALDAVVRKVTTVLELSGAGVTLHVDGRPRFVTAAGEQIEAMERCQERFAAGPCAHAFAHGETIAVSDVRRRDDLWPEFAAEARRREIAAVAGVPMQLGEVKIGALDLYCREPREWADDELAAAQVFADMATGYIVNSDKLRQQEQLSAQLQTALDTRIVVEQAKGITAQARGVTPAAAFELIRAYARRHQAPVRAVAQAIVDVGLRI
ncbi:GAF and ANTAR domain-containing protein [Rhodococcus aetherivorans]|uniref:GAF and ANTAR domain-containing protein n=1 Tax=Rhodococcus aetherivorans TaxID=191292 RepID=UPI00163AE773|nr:GAF and ANTAR domain-containing protein [Rhodococcus aetherivorans]MBC2591680.1 GAF and ANTAR domain-containing protein [Rhodococcus aetherivorans]